MYRKPRTKEAVALEHLNFTDDAQPKEEYEPDHEPMLSEKRIPEPDLRELLESPERKPKPKHPEWNPKTAADAGSTTGCEAKGGHLIKLVKNNDVYDDDEYLTCDSCNQLIIMPHGFYHCYECNAFD